MSREIFKEICVSHRKRYRRSIVDNIPKLCAVLLGGCDGKDKKK